MKQHTMYLSLNWLKDFVKYKQTPEQVAEVLTLGGFEVEKIENKGKDLESIIVGQIKTIVSHAEADKLVVCKVDVGRKELLSIVCGARNIKAGHKVPVALVDVILPNGLKIERRRIRGVDSEGMLCAEDELGLGEDHSGILILDKEARIGQKLNKVLGLDDIVLDIAVSPNRADGFSVYGLAVEFAALSGQKLIEKKVIVSESKKISVSELVSVKVQDYDLCPKYTARVIKNVKVKPSPQWLQSRLRVSGIKPVNNIVDITNYVMLERGQPLHAFDLDKVQGHKIIVGKAGQAKQFITLDKVERELLASDLMINDSQEPIAIAGVMGGVSSEISLQTKDIVIESAIFKPLSIRKTRQRLGLVTEASTRFEKGIWWNSPEWASDRAAQLIADIAGGEVAKGIIIAAKQKDQAVKVIKIKLSYINNLIGRKFSLSEIKKHLERLHFQVAVSKDELTVTVPSWRQDVKIPADIVEEVGRMHGWNNLKPAPIFAELKSVSQTNKQVIINAVQQALVEAGLQETLNYSFYGQDLINKFKLYTKSHFKVLNPLNPEQEYLRACLLPRLYENLLKNYQTREAVALFEIGQVFQKNSKGEVQEQTMLAGVLFDKGRGKDSNAVIRRLKGVAQFLFDKLNLGQELSFASKNGGEVIEIRIDKIKVGGFCWLTQSASKFKTLPACFEINLNEVVKFGTPAKKFQIISEYPTVEHDLTFVTPKDTDYFDIVKIIEQLDPLIVKFNGEGVPYRHSANEFSITFKIVFQAADRTLKSAEVEQVRQKIISTVTNKFNMKLKQ